jgi:hypothetical protein
MANTELHRLARHCRSQADIDAQRLAVTHKGRIEANRLKARIALWLQLADEIDAYLDHERTHANQPASEQLTLGEA